MPVRACWTDIEADEDLLFIRHVADQPAQRRRQPFDERGRGDNLVVARERQVLVDVHHLEVVHALQMFLTAIRRIERGIEYRLRDTQPLGPERLAALAPVLFDRMTEMVLFNAEHAQRLFGHAAPKPLVQVNRDTLESANRELGLALSADEMALISQMGSPTGRLTDFGFAPKWD